MHKEELDKYLSTRSDCFEILKEIIFTILKPCGS